MWQDDSLLAVDGTLFETLGSAEGSFGRALAMRDRQSEPGHFLLQKPRPTVERYMAMLDELRPRTIVELGIFEGGSTALIASYAKPDRLAAFELEERGQPALDQWIDDRAIGDHVKAHYGVDQGDVSRLMSLVDDEFGDELLDLVIDDASHTLEPSRRSFDALFPRLRPGGVYLLEDWAVGQHLGMFRAGQPPMSFLLVELLITMADDIDLSGPSAIDRIEVFGDVAMVRRGPAPVAPGSFHVGAALSQLRERLAGTTS